MCVKLPGGGGGGKTISSHQSITSEMECECFKNVCILVLLTYSIDRPLAGYGLPPPPRGNFVDHIFLEAQCLARILQHVSPLTMAALSCNSLLHTLPYKIFDN